MTVTSFNIKMKRGIQLPKMKYDGMRHSAPNGSTPTRDSAMTVAEVSGTLIFCHKLPSRMRGKTLFG